MESLLNQERKIFHRALLDSCLTIDAKGIPSIADKHQKTSCFLVASIVEKVGAATTAIRNPG